MILAITMTSAAPSCIECTNVRTPWMKKNDKTCETWEYMIDARCNKKSRWRNNKYCQQTCFDGGVGYDGDICCVDAASPPPSASPSPPPSASPSPPPSASPSPPPSGYLFTSNSLLLTSVNEWCENDETTVDAGDIDTWDTSRVTSLDDVFSGLPCNEDISKWDVSKVTSMLDTFSESGFKGDLSQWDVSSVTDLEYTFAFSNFNSPLNTWDTSSLVNMHSTFSQSAFNQDISVWDVSKVIYMDYTFADTPFNQDISSWDVRNVVDMTDIFKNTPLSDCNKFRIAVSWIDQTAAFPYPTWVGLTPC